MVLACEQPMTGYHETNFSMAYSSHISWQSADSPVPMEVYPSLAFDSLFENRGSLRNMSILDRVKERAEALSAQISSTDKAKLDEYLTSVREVEKRVERHAQRQGQGRRAREAQSNAARLTMERPANGLPEDIREHMRLMCDIVASPSRPTRPASPRCFCAAISRRCIYPFLDVQDGHHPPRTTTVGRLRAHLRFHVSQLAYLAAKLDSMPEGDGTVLDNTCLMFLSNMWSAASTTTAGCPSSWPAASAAR